MTKTEKEKGEEVLRKRKRAKQGLKPEGEDNSDPIEEKDREKKIAATAAVGLGLKRSG